MKNQPRSGVGSQARAPKSALRSGGTTTLGLTALDVRAGRRVSLDAATRSHVQRRMARQLGKFTVLIENAAVRFEDINGKRGGVDISCRIKVALSALPSVVVEQRATTARAAFDAAASGTERAVRRAVGRAEMSARAPRGKPPLPVATPERAKTSKRGAIVVDTSLPGVSATDRKVGAGSTATRNFKKNLAGLTSALEDSAQPTPSRKSTRRGEKRDSNLQRRAIRKLHSPQERAGKKSS